MRKIVAHKKIPHLFYLPLWAYGVIYVITCGIGCTLALIPITEFIQQYKLNSGILMPILSQKEWWDNFALVYLAPLLLALGFITTTIAMSRSLNAGFITGTSKKNSPTFFYLTQIFYYGLLLWALVDLYQAGSFHHVDNWTHYAKWTLSRWALFEHIGFFGFVNLYTFLPIVAGAILLSSNRTTGWKQHCLKILPILLTLAVQCFLYQKKPPLISIILFTISGVLYLLQNQKITWQRCQKILLSSVLLVALSYTILLLLPLCQQFSHSEQSLYDLGHSSIMNKLLVEKHAPGFLQMPLSFNTHPTTPTKNQTDAQFLLYYTLMAPITRTSIPSLYYVKIYPTQHPYYGLDLGQDILGFGNMPDDDRVVWHVINPSLPGAITAPFQFGLYAQVGLPLALSLSFVLGIVLAAVWQGILRSSLPSLITSLSGAVWVTFSLYLTIDSIRNSLLSSYGMLWGIVAVFILLGLYAIKGSKAVHTCFTSRCESAG